MVEPSTDVSRSDSVAPVASDTRPAAQAGVLDDADAGATVAQSRNGQRATVRKGDGAYVDRAVLQGEGGAGADVDRAVGGAVDEDVVERRGGARRSARAFDIERRAAGSDRQRPVADRRAVLDRQGRAVVDGDLAVAPTVNGEIVEDRSRTRCSRCIRDLDDAAVACDRQGAAADCGPASSVRFAPDSTTICAEFVTVTPLNVAPLAPSPIAISIAV